MLHKHDDGNPQKEDSAAEHFGVHKLICLLRIIGGKERMIYYDCQPTPGIWLCDRLWREHIKSPEVSSSHLDRVLLSPNLLRFAHRCCTSSPRRITADRCVCADFQRWPR